jgi:ATP/maltotriose-dependent transcriptional regulator MalT
VPAGRGERDSQRFWLSVLAALRQTAAGSVLVRELTAAPELDGWVITERLLTDLAPLDDQLWLVVDDVHELGPDALAQLELLIMRGPPGAAGQARQDEAEVWVQRAERTITAEAAQPAMFAGIRYVRGVVEMARDHDAEALAAFEAAEQLARRLAAPHYLISRIRPGCSVP